MPRFPQLIVFLLAFLVALPAASAATPQEIENALARAKAWLYQQQNDQGTWETLPQPDPKASFNSHGGGQWGGRTAIATYALLAAGESPQDPRLARAIDFLKKADIRGIYAVALRMQVWYYLPPTNEVRQLVARDARILINSIKTEGDSLGHYDYVAGIERRSSEYSHSRSQYGVLGVWTAALMGYEVPARYWQMVEAGWLQNIDPSGGWSYQHPKRTKYPVTAGMTAAGVASLYVTQDYLYATRGLDCRSSRPTNSDIAIQAGMKWLIDNFDKVATNEKYERDFPFATLYAIERVGVASGQKYFGDIDWYEKGANWLLQVQEKNGSFRKGTHSAVGQLPATCFAILFLARGGAPIMMNKLEYTLDGNKPAPWNNRTRDVANAARWAGRSFERELNWQIVNLRGKARDLHDAPILYISGNQALRLSDEDKQILKEYVEQGGLIFGHADCGSSAFASSFRQLGQELFPKYEFRLLPDDHPIHTINYQRRNWRNPPQLLGLNNGARELMVLAATGDPGRAWQMLAVGGNEPAWEMIANLYLYATDRDIARKRGDTHLIEKNDKIKPSSKIAVARLEHSGNWNPEPGGWVRLANYMHNQHRVELTLSTVQLGQPIEAKIAHLTGTEPLQLTDDQKTALKAFIEGGGTLVVDATGGSSAFASSIEAVLAELFPESKLELIPPDHAVFSPGGKPIENISYRTAARQMLGNLDGPRLRGLKIGNRLGVIYSREDLSAGLVGQRVAGIVGYTPETASALMSAILLHAGK